MWRGAVDGLRVGRKISLGRGNGCETSLVRYTGCRFIFRRETSRFIPPSICESHATPPSLHVVVARHRRDDALAACSDIAPVDARVR